jgi:hypothetical protein
MNVMILLEDLDIRRGEHSARDEGGAGGINGNKTIVIIDGNADRAKPRRIRWQGRIVGVLDVNDVSITLWTSGRPHKPNRIRRSSTLGLARDPGTAGPSGSPAVPSSL